MSASERSADRCVSPGSSLDRPAVRVNETDTFDEERNENDDFFDFDDGASLPARSETV